MWLYTKLGFVSVVQHRDDPETLLIRARFKEDIEKLAEVMGEATDKPTSWRETPDADYRYRLTCPREVFQAIIMWLVSTIDYTNFKNAVHGNPVRDDSYMRCWMAMNNAQKKEISDFT